MWRNNFCLVLSACFVAVVCGGCSASQIANTTATDLLTPALAAGGAGAGLYATKDRDIGTQLAGTGAGLLGGYILGQFIEYGFREQKLKEFKTGYHLGRSNATKELYWAFQDLHKAQEGDANMSVYEIPIPDPDDGVKRSTQNVKLIVTE